MDRSKYLKIWSAACSNGAEPYSIAVQLLANGFKFDILATDISDIALEKARRAVYVCDSVADIPHHILYRYFQRGHGRQKDYVKVKDEVRKHITFMKYNLLSDRQPDGQFDIIFCRNVMMYFDDNDRERLIQKLYRSMNHGGYLIIGMAENIFGYNNKFNPIKKKPSIYIKTM